MTSTRPQPGTARCPDCGREVDAAADLCACGFPLMFLRQEEQPSASLAPSRRPVQLDDDDTDELPVVVLPEPYAAAPALAHQAPYEEVDLVEEIVCASCQEVNPVTRTWCARCGASLRERAVVPEELPPPRPTGRVPGRALAVLGLVLLLVGAAVGAVLLLDREPTGPAAVGPLQVLEVTASATAEDSTSPGTPVVSYAARNVLDDDPSTAWRVPGDGVDQFLTFTFAEPREVTRVGLVPGYAKVDPVDGTDRFVQNRRITSVVWVLGDGVEVPQTIPSPPGREMVLHDLEAPVETTEVVLRITGSTPPGGDGVDPRDFAPISEVLLEGR